MGSIAYSDRPGPFVSFAPYSSDRASSAMPQIYLGDYAALSYVRGDENDTRRIVVNDQEVSVTANLATALKAFSDQAEFEGSFKLWVDAICINQMDLEERARQV